MSDMNKPLDGNGLLYLWQRLKTMFATLDAKIDALSVNLSGMGGGDMMKATYDADGDGIVDNAEKLGGKTPDSYALADGTNTKAAFTTATSRTNITTGEALNIILGKIAKWFSDLGTLAFKSTVAKNDLDSDVQVSLGKADTALQSFTEKDPTVPAWAKAATKPTYTASEVGALPSTTKIPTTVAELTDSANYAKKSDLTNVYRYKGSKATYAQLPTTGNTVGDVWDVVADGGMNYGWNGSAWDALGKVFTISYMTNAEIDEILAT